jgi:hypothetical protein
VNYRDKETGLQKVPRLDEAIVRDAPAMTAFWGRDAIRYRSPRKASPEAASGKDGCCNAFSVARPLWLRLDDSGLRGPMMRPRRESWPLWVRLTLGLIIAGTVAFMTGYFVIEDLLAFFK